MPTNLTSTGFINHGSAAWIRKIWMRDRIYNYVREYRYKAGYRIQENSRYRYKNWGTDTKRGTGFKKKQGTDRKTKVPIRYRTKKNAVLHKTKLKGGNRHQNKNSECRFCKKISSIYGTRRVPITYEERWSPALTKHMDPENFTSPRWNCAGAGAEDPEWEPDPVATSSAAPPLSSGKPPTAPGTLNPDACAINTADE